MGRTHTLTHARCGAKSRLMESQVLRARMAFGAVWLLSIAVQVSMEAEAASLTGGSQCLAIQQYQFVCPNQPLDVEDADVQQFNAMIKQLRSQPVDSIQGVVDKGLKQAAAIWKQEEVHKTKARAKKVHKPSKMKERVHAARKEAKKVKAKAKGAQKDVQKA